MVVSSRKFLLLLGLGLFPGFGAGVVRAQIPPGFEVIRLTDDPDMDGDPAINNFGQVVWSKRIDQGFDTEEIFFFDGVEVRRITDDDFRDAFPDLNDFGTLVWSRGKRPGGTENFEIAMWRDGRMTLLTDNEVGDWAPTVNNLDHMAWYRKSGLGCSGSHLMFYDALVIEQRTDDERSNQIPEINRSDEIAWVAFDFCQNPWMSTIKMYSRDRTIELTNGESQDSPTTINNRSQVAWANRYPEFRGIFLWANGRTRQIIDAGRIPRINERGTIAFVRIDEDLSIPEQWLRVDGELLRLSDPGIPSAKGAINDCGEVSWWFGDFPDLDIVLMRMKPGDATHDGFVSLNDFSILDGCISGPRDRDDSCRGEGSDVDRDGDVDLRDFVLREVESRELEEIADLIECMTGPMDLDEFCACRALDIDHDRDVDLRDFASFQTLLRASP